MIDVSNKDNLVQIIRIIEVTATDNRILTGLSWGILAFCFAMATAREKPPIASTRPLEAASFPVQTLPCATSSIFSTWKKKKKSGAFSAVSRKKFFGDQKDNQDTIQAFLSKKPPCHETSCMHSVPSWKKVLPRLAWHSKISLGISMRNVYKHNQRFLWTSLLPKRSLLSCKKLSKSSPWYNLLVEANFLIQVPQVKFSYKNDQEYQYQYQYNKLQNYGKLRYGSTAFARHESTRVKGSRCLFCWCSPKVHQFATNI